MATITLATLLIKLEADNSQYKKGVKDSKDAAAEFREEVKRTAAAMEGQASESASSAARMGAYAAKAKDAEKVLSMLNKEVAAGNITVGEAAAVYNKVEGELQDYQRELGLTDKELEKLGAGVTNNSTKWTELSSMLGLAREGFGYVQQAAQFAYESLSRGAELELARSQFDNLAKSIGTTSDALLNDLGAATNGMMTNAGMIESASQLISLGLADDQEGVVRLSTAVSTLGLDMQQVIMTFANNSKARLDALGLSVQDVTARAKELEDQGFVGDAFDEAVLEGLEAKMTLLGDASETTAGKLKILNATWQNTRDAFDQAFAANSAQALGMMADNADAANAGLQRMARIGGAALSNSLIQLVDQFGTTRLFLQWLGKRDLKEAEEAQQAYAAAVDLTNAEMGAWQARMAQIKPVAQEHLQINEETGLVMQDLSDEYRNVMRILGQHSPAMAQDTREMEDAAYASGELGDAQDRLAGYIEESKKAAEEEARAIEESTKRKEENARIQAELTRKTADYFVEATQSADAQLDVNAALYDSVIAAGASAEQIALVGIATGQLTKEQANAALTSALIQAKIDELTASYAAGEISVGEMRTELQGYVSDLQEVPPSVPTDLILNGISEARADVRGLINELGQVPRHVRVDVETVRTESGGGSSGGGGGKGGGKQHGGFTYGVEGVAAGVVHGQEFVFSAPAVRNIGLPALSDLHELGRTAGGSGGAGGGIGGGDTYIFNNNSREAAALSHAVVAERRRKHIDTYMGVG